MKTFLITGANLVNKGAQAMLLITASEIRERYPDAEIYYTTHESEGDKEKDYQLHYMYKYGLINALGIASGLLKGVEKWKNIAEQVGKCVLKRNWSNVLCQIKYLNIVKKIDVLIDISGYNLSSQWPLRISRNYLNTIKYAHALGIEIYLLPQSFGPFEYGKEQEKMDAEIREVLSYAKMIFARERGGYELLTQKYQLQNVVRSYDLVLQNKEIHWENVLVEGRLPESNIDITSGNKVGIVPNKRSYQNMHDGTIMECYKKIVQKLLSMNKEVYLIFHSKEDVYICEQIKNLFKDNDKVVFLRDELNSYDFELLVSKFDFIVASRFHSIVHAYKENVPCIVLAWAQKYYDLLSEFQQNKYLFDVRQTFEVGDLLMMIEEMDHNLRAEKGQLKSNLDRIQQENCFRLLFDKEYKEK